MRALLIIDVQNDFCPGGALAVPEGDRIVPLVNRLAGQFEHIVQTQDWHPAGHESFASAHEGRAPFDTVQASYGAQTLWPDHCIRGTEGAAFHPDLDTTATELIIRKGFRREIDSYSAFFENDHETPTGLTGYLRERGIDEVFVAGLATDFCVKWTVLDALDQGFAVHVVEDAVRGIDQPAGRVEEAWAEMREAGAEVTNTEALPGSLATE